MNKITFHTIAVVVMIILFLLEWLLRGGIYGLATSISMLIVGPIQFFLAIKSVTRSGERKNFIFTYILLSVATVVWITTDHRIDIDDIAFPSQQFYLQTRIAPLALALFYLFILFQSRSKTV